MALEIPLSAMLFQATNGLLLGMWLSGRAPRWVPTLPTEATLSSTYNLWAAAYEGAASYASRTSPAPTPLFWTLLGLATIMLLSNIYHDEILLSLRRGRPRRTALSSDKTTVQRGEQTYSIPQGGLFRWIDHPH